MSDAQIAEMCALRERGWGIDRIAEHFTNAGTKVSSGTINWQCLVEGADAPVRLRGKHRQPVAAYRRNGHIVRPFSPEEDEALRAMSAAGDGPLKMARALDRGHNSVIGRLLTLARMDARAEYLAQCAG